MSFSLGSSRNPAIIVARTPVSRAQFKTVGQLRADEAAARSGRRQASYAANRLVAVPRGVPMYAVGHGQMGRGEVKFFDVQIVGPVTSNPYGLLTFTAPPVGGEPASAFTGITELNCVAQGATSYNRIGTKIQIKSIDFRANFFLAGSAPTYAGVRYMIVYDRQPNGAFPAFSDILSENVSSAPIFHSGVNMSNRSRFVVLRDRILTLSTGTDNIVVCKEFIKTKLETQFKTNTGAIGDITTGALYLVAFSTLSSSAVYAQLSNAHCRIRYFD